MIGEKDGDISVTPDTLDFGIVHPNSQKLLDFSINNLTNSNYSINQLQIRNHDDIFSLRDFNPFVLQPKNQDGSSHSVYVMATADKDYGNFIDSIYINDLRNPDVKLLITIPAVYGADVDFGDIAIGDDLGSKFIEIHNISDKNVTIQNIIISDNAFDLKPNSNDFEIEANASKELIITFKPTEVKSYLATISFDVNPDFGYPVDKAIELSGNGAN